MSYGVLLAYRNYRLYKRKSYVLYHDLSLRLPLIFSFIDSSFWHSLTITLSTTHYTSIMYTVVGKLNSRLCHLIPPTSLSHKHHTRRKQLIKGKKQKLECTSFSVACKGPELWNELDKIILESRILYGFKKKLKTELWQKYVWSKTPDGWWTWKWHCLRPYNQYCVLRCS